MESIEKHIEKDKEILQDPTVSPQMRRHTADEQNIWNVTPKNTQKKSKQEIITIQVFLKCIVMKIQKQTSVEFTKTDATIL